MFRLARGCPFQSPGGFSSYTANLSGVKVRARSKKFFDHFTQATLFWKSQSVPEQNHIVKALQFELSHVAAEEVRVRMLGILSMIAKELAERVAKGLGHAVPGTVRYCGRVFLC